jgi:hypothetical protein
MIVHDFGKRMISMNENEKEWSARTGYYVNELQRPVNS